MLIRKLIILICSFGIMISVLTLAAIDPARRNVYASDIITEDGSNFYLENQAIKVTINKSTGFIDKIENKKNGTVNKKSGKGSWPFRIDLSNKTTAEISSATVNRISSYEIKASGSGMKLSVTYDDLSTNGSPAVKTGIKAVIVYYFEMDDNFFSFSAAFTNNGSQDIVNIVLCEGGSLSSGTSSPELVIPIWGEMAYWNDPLVQWKSYTVKNPRRMAYPGRGWNDLEMGFMDYSSDAGGIGIAYINKQQTLMEFRVGTDNGGFSFAPSLLSTSIAGIITPVAPGQSFSTDEVIIAAHDNDWHSMADIYREKFRAAFTSGGKADYLTWDTISPFVKASDYGLRFHERDFGYVFPDVTSRLEAWGDLADPAALMVWYSGQNEHGYGHDVPTMIPANPSLGGTSALRKLSEDLHSIGANIFHYEHPTAFATDSSDYPAVASSDPGQTSGSWDGVNHRYLIITDEVFDLWKNKLIPDIKTVKPDGLQFDQGSLQFTVGVAGSAAERLSQNTKALVELSKYVRNNLVDGKTAYIVSEGFCDLTCRYVDISQTRWDKEQFPINGGELIFGGRQYVHPQYVNMYNTAMRLESGVWKNTRQYAAILGGISNLNQNEGYMDGSDTEYLWFKKQMRETKAPGYPYNYRDDVGITSSDPKLFVRSYTEGNKATIVMFTDNKSQTDAKVKLEPAKLGLSGKAAEFVFDLARNRTGYIIYDTTSGKVEKTSLDIKNRTTPTVTPSVSTSASESSVSADVSLSPESSAEEISVAESEPDEESGLSGGDISDASDVRSISDISIISSVISSDTSGTGEDGYAANRNQLVLIIVVISAAVLLVAAFLTVLATEKPEALYRLIVRSQKNSESKK